MDGRRAQRPTRKKSNGKCSVENNFGKRKYVITGITNLRETKRGHQTWTAGGIPNMIEW